MTEIGEVFNHLHKKARFLPIFPSEEVIKWRHRELTPPMKVLVIGCGGGRHVLYLAREGFICTGIDISDNGLRETNLRTRSEDLEVELVLSDFLSFSSITPDEHFDAILAFSVLYYQSEATFNLCLSEISRILKIGGKLFFNMRSHQDWRHQYQNSEGRLAELESNGTRLVEANLPHIFFDLNSLMKLIPSSFNIKTGSYSSEFEGKLNHNLLIDATKF